MKNEAAFRMTESERSVASTTAMTLMGAPPHRVDELRWVNACRALSCRLPRRLRERLRKFRQDPGSEGALVVRNLPTAYHLPPTPIEPDSVERTATLGAALLALISMDLGEIIAYSNEKAGALIQNVVPVPGREKEQGNAGSAPLEMHVENAFHPHRPDLVGLLCVRGDHDEIAALRVASIREAVHYLPDDVRKVLAEERFATSAPPSFGCPQGEVPPHAVLSGDFDDPDVLVDFNATYPLDDGAAEARDALRHAITSVIRTILLRPGDLAIVDNRVALHGRSQFIPRYDGHDRWLYRTFIHFDHRRSRAFRSLDGHVLT